MAPLKVGQLSIWLRPKATNITIHNMDGMGNKKFMNC